MDERIQARMTDTRKILLENFDEDVHERLRIQLKDAKAQLDKFSKRFWSVTHHILDGKAQFNDDVTCPQSPYQSIFKKSVVCKIN
jgi:hypothetical protein